MQHKKIKIALSGLAAVAFLALGCVDSGKIKQLENEVSRLTELAQQKDAQINTLTVDLAAKQNEVTGVRKELESAKQELDLANNTLAGVQLELENTKKELDGVSAQLKALPPAAPVKGK